MGESLGDGDVQGLPLKGGRVLPLAVLHFTFARSGGPGGQGVNKLSTKVQMRVAVKDLEPVLGPSATARLRQLGRPWLTAQDELLLTHEATRSQHTNRQACVQRLRGLLLAALTPPRPRRATRPTAGARRRRRQAKEHRAAQKRARGERWDAN